jgi:putative ABC transport system permease protein
VRAIQKGTYQIVSTVENRWRARLASGFFIFSFLGLFSDSRFVFYAALISMLFAALLLTPWLSLLLSKALRPVLRRTFPIEGTLAADSLISAPRRTSATVGALMLSLTLVVVFGGFIGALYESVDQWLDSEFNADFFVSTSANLTARSATFPAELGAVIERVEGVEQVLLVRNARITFRRVPVLVMAIETAKAAGRSKQSVVAGDRHEMNRLTASGKGTIVSQSFATTHGLRIGDIVELPAPAGALRLTVAGIIRDYSDLQGSLFIDRTIYKEWWNDDSANTARVYLKPDQHPDDVHQRILDALAIHQGLLVLNNREVRAWVINLLDSWFSMSYNQIFVAILVAILGVANSVTVSINDRKRELAVMQAVGGLRSQIRQTIWMEAVSIAIIGAILSIGLGALSLYYALAIVKQDLARVDLDYVFPFSLMLVTIPAILIAAFVAAIGPAESAVRNKLVEALEYE